jgi:hypothetical protein
MHGEIHVDFFLKKGFNYSQARGYVDDLEGFT